MNVLDDSLSADRAAAGTLTAEMIERFGTLARYCTNSGADAVKRARGTFDDTRLTQYRQS